MSKAWFWVLEVLEEKTSDGELRCDAMLDGTAKAGYIE